MPNGLQLIYNAKCDTYNLINHCNNLSSSGVTPVFCKHTEFILRDSLMRFIYFFTHKICHCISS